MSVNPNDLQNTMVAPETLTNREATGEHQERRRAPCDGGADESSTGETLTQRHEWLNDNCQDRGDEDDEPEAS